MPSGGSSGTTSRVMRNLNLPAGFRFHPTDEELIVHYLMNQAASIPCPVPIIAEVNIYQCNPWDLPGKALFGENEWYFFSPRDRKYPNGVRPNRAAGSGYWKATGTDKAILSTPTSRNIGVKKALVFYGGRPPRGVKTDWIMHEYRLTDHDTARRRAPAGSGSSSSMRLDDWVLCRIHKKSNDFFQQPSSSSSEQEHEHEQEGSTVEELDIDTLLNNNNSNNITNDVSTENHGRLHGENGTAAMMTTMSKSCSLTDLLNSIDDYASLSQTMFFLDDAPPAAVTDEPSQQGLAPPLIYPPPNPAQTAATHQAALTSNNNYGNDNNAVTMNSSSSSHVGVGGLLPATAALVDAVVSSDSNGVNKRKRVMAVDGTAAAESSFGDAAGDSGFSSKKLLMMKLPTSDPRNAAGGHHFGATTSSSSYCSNHQLQLVDSTSGGFNHHHHQYSSLLLSSNMNSHPFLSQQHQLMLNSHIGMQ